MDEEGSSKIKGINKRAYESVCTFDFSLNYSANVSEKLTEVHYCELPFCSQKIIPSQLLKSIYI